MHRIRLAVALLVISAAIGDALAEPVWQRVEATGEPTARHEADFVALGGKLYLIGGRRVNPVDEFDPATGAWRRLSPSPIELHHLQSVAVGDELWIAMAMTGPFPNEKPLDRVYRYRVAADEWLPGPRIPEGRRRGGAGAVLHEGAIYVVGGIVRGHLGGYVPWFDRLDLETGEWTALADAPHARDHFHAEVMGGKLYCAGGRRTSYGTGDLFNLTVPEVDVYDFATGVWSTLAEPLPTPRAGAAVRAINGRLVVIGGESGPQKLAHNEVEAYDPITKTWSAWPRLLRGRHGTAAPLIGDTLYIASGSGGRGGGPELKSVEKFQLPPAE